MKISEVIKQLEVEKQKHGDVVCTTFQHPEEEEGMQPISSFYFRKDDKELHIS